MKKQQQRNVRKVQVPLAKGAVVVTNKPKFSMTNGGDGRVLVRHREYVSDIAGSVGFAVSPFVINPGLNSSFPWLSQIATAYESYKFKKLRFIYEPSVSTTTTGMMLLTVDYDANDPAPASKTQALAYQHAVRTPVWQSCAYIADAQDLSKLPQKFVRTNDLVVIDPLLYDAGNLFVCTFGESGTTTIGELHVEYEVELYTPQLNLPVLGATIQSSGTFTSNGLGDTNVVSGDSRFSVVNGVIRAPPGHYLVEVWWVGTALTDTTIAATVGGTDSVKYGHAPNLITNTATTNRVLSFRWYHVDPLNGNFVMSGVSDFATISSCYVSISVLDYNLV